MTRHDRSAALREYLLGACTDEECAAIESEYFEHAPSLHELSEIEDDLIADYLEARLAAEELDRFERHYLASPRHRTRVAITRALRNASGTHDALVTAATRWGRVLGAVRAWPPLGQAAAAVGLVILSVAVWRLNSPLSPAPSTRPDIETRPSESEARQPSMQPEGPKLQPVVIVLSIAPVNVRAAGDAATLTIPSSADVVALELQSDAGEPPIDQGRAIVRAVGGREVWRGPVTPRSAARPEIVARVEIPVIRLSPDDYIVELLGLEPSGREVERHRYFFRVRQR